jgi:hypothetical protein
MAINSSGLHQVEFFLPRFNQQIKFPAYITDLSDQFSSDWQTDVQYGFQDPIGAFIGTTRKITLGLRVVASDFTESAEYQIKLNKIVQSLYPIYTEGVVPSTSPIVGMRVVNLIHGGKTKDGFLFGWLDGLNLSPNVGEGGFYSDEGQMLPKLWDLSFGFNVIHKERPGTFEKEGSKFSLGNSSQYPVRVSSEDAIVSDLITTVIESPAEPNQARAGQSPAARAGARAGRRRNGNN